MLVKIVSSCKYLRANSGCIQTTCHVYIDFLGSAFYKHLLIYINKYEYVVHNFASDDILLPV